MTEKNPVLLTPARAVQPFCRAEVAALLFLFLLFTTPAWSQQHDMHTHDRSGLNGRDTNVVAEAPNVTAERLAWKRESELVHHLAGLLVLLAGIFILGEDRLAKRWSSLRYAWPTCFLAAGLFLLVFSDT